jgi:hypothetical protein
VAAVIFIVLGYGTWNRMGLVHLNTTGQMSLEWFWFQELEQNSIVSFPQYPSKEFPHLFTCGHSFGRGVSFSGSRNINFVDNALFAGTMHGHVL